jgi:hypothetical protein
MRYIGWDVHYGSSTYCILEENGRGIGHAARPEPDHRDRREKRRFREEKGTGDIVRQDADATIGGITRPDSAPGD